MEIKNTIGVSGRGRIFVFDQFGNLLRAEKFSNVVTTNGKNEIAKRLVYDAKNLWNNVVWGTDSTTPTVSDTSLGSAVLTNSVTSTDYGGAQTTLVEGVLGTGEANGYTIAEFGTESNDNVLINRATDFTSIDKTDQKVVYLEYEVQIQ